MNTSELKKLAQLWLELKEQESAAILRRLELQRKIKKMAGFPDRVDGSYAVVVGPYVIKEESKIVREIDVDFLFRVALKYKLTRYLPKLFKFKAKVNKGMWRFWGEELPKPFNSALDSKFGDPTFTVIKKKN